MDHSSDPHRYDDIMDLPHHVSTVRPPMPLQDRAAQFAPFAALTGYDTAVRETAAQHECDMIAQNSASALSEKLQALREQLDAGQRPSVSIDCSCSETAEAGDDCIRITGTVRKLDWAGRLIVLTDGAVLSLDHVLDIHGAWLDRGP